MYPIEKKKKNAQPQPKITIIVLAFLVFSLLVFFGSFLVFWMRGNYIASLAPSAIVPVEDPAEGASPDFRLLEVEYDAETIRVIIHFHDSRDVQLAGHHVYLYGSDRHSIAFSHLLNGSFWIDLDSDANGHFETRVYEGLIETIGDEAIQLSFPISMMPDMAEKNIWVFSQDSRDRIPDEGSAQFDS